MLPQTQQVQAMAGPDGTLHVDPRGVINVVINRHTDLDGTPSITISFGGVNQAHVTFDATGTRPISFYIYNLNPPPQLVQSIQNIVGWVAGPPTLH